MTLALAAWLPLPFVAIRRSWATVLSLRGQVGMCSAAIAAVGVALVPMATSNSERDFSSLSRSVLERAGATHRYDQPTEVATRASYGYDDRSNLKRGGISRPASVLAAKGEAKLYRAVSDDELADIARHGFRPGRGTMETKLFATSAEDAARFGRANYRLDGKPFTILEARVPGSVERALYRGTADQMAIRGVNPAMLARFNQLARVRALNSIPIGP